MCVSACVCTCENGACSLPPSLPPSKSLSPDGLIVRTMRRARPTCAARGAPTSLPHRPQVRACQRSVPHPPSPLPALVSLLYFRVPVLNQNAHRQTGRHSALVWSMGKALRCRRPVPGQRFGPRGRSGHGGGLVICPRQIR